MKTFYKNLVAATVWLGSLQPAGACLNYLGMNIADGVASYDQQGKLIGTWPHAQIWNPVDSGKIIKVSRLSVAFTVWNAQTEFRGRGADIVTQTAPMTLNNDVRTQCKNIGDTTPPVAEMRVGNFSTSQVTGVRPIYELWPNITFQGKLVIGKDLNGVDIIQPFTLGTSENDKEYPFDPPIEIPPGHGIAVRPAQPAIYVVTSWQWQEVEVSP